MEQKSKVIHASEEQCLLGLKEQVRLATRAPSWMGVMFFVEGDEVMVSKTTCNFPTRFFEKCAATLTRMLKQEFLQCLEEESLPMAPYLENQNDKMDPAATELSSQEASGQHGHTQPGQKIGENSSPAKNNGHSDSGPDYTS